MPEKIEDYEVLGVVGIGSFGTCYRVRKKATSHVFVWKAVDYGSMSEDRKKLLVSEVNLLREMKHPNIVQYYDRILHKESGTLYIIMEWCERGDLATLINKCRRNNTYVDESFVWKVLYQSSCALRACHGPGRPFLHRDIKPANLFLDSDFNIKLGDFGLARVLNTKSGEEEDVDIFCAHSIVGTPFYMSPEVVKESKYNRKSDVWSLGCVIYELCCLFPPFTGHTGRDLAHKIKHGRFSRIPTYYSDELHHIIAFMLTVDHDIRPSIEAILHHPSVVSHIAQWSLIKPFYRRKNVLSEINSSGNKSEIFLNETFCSCIGDCCADEMPSINTQLGAPTTFKKVEFYSTEHKPTIMLMTSNIGTGQIKSIMESKVLAKADSQKKKNLNVVKDITSSFTEHLNLLRQRESKLRMRELTLEEREQAVKRKEREAALASRIARETMGRACVYLKNCREVSRGSASITMTKLTVQSRNNNENLPLLQDADSSLDHENGETSTIAITSARLDPRAISQPFWHGDTTERQKVKFGLRNSQPLAESYIDSNTSSNTYNSGKSTVKNCKGILRPRSWSDNQTLLEVKRHTDRKEMDILGKENKVPMVKKVNQFPDLKASAKVYIQKF